MGLFDSGIANFIRMLIVIGLISMLYMFVMQKVREQNHKITSMLTLITTLASEVNSLKSAPAPFFMEETTENLINVSDDSDSESDSDSEDDCDSEDECENKIVENIKNDSIEFTETPEQVHFENEFLKEVDDLEELQKITSDDNLDVPDISVNVVDQSTGTVKYHETALKKMSVSQLSQIAIQSSLILPEDAKKMKKPALLALLL